MPAINPFTRGLGAGSDLIPVTPSDTVDLPAAGRAIRCRPDGVGGTLRINVNDGPTRNTYIAAGETLLVAVSRVFATGTTATGLEVYV